MAPQFKMQLIERSNVGCVGRCEEEEEGEEQEVSGSGRESRRDGWMNGGENSARNTRH